MDRFAIRLSGNKKWTVSFEIVHFFYLPIERAKVYSAELCEDACPEGGTEEEGQQEGHKRNLQNGKDFIGMQQAIETAIDEKILKKTVKNINADGIFSKAAKKGFLLGAKVEQPEQH